MLDEYREKLLSDPVNYAVLLRRQNALHSVWHLELQEKIAALEAENAQLREELYARD